MHDSQNDRLKQAQSIIRSIFLTRNSESGIDGNDMRVIKAWKRDLLWTQAGYGFLHHMLWLVLSRQEDPHALINGQAGLLEGVYAKLTENHSPLMKFHCFMRSRMIYQLDAKQFCIGMPMLVM